MYILTAHYQCFNSLQSTNTPSWMRDCRDWFHSVNHTVSNTTKLSGSRRCENKSEHSWGSKDGGKIRCSLWAWAKPLYTLQEAAQTRETLARTQSSKRHDAYMW
jgi:hypothetical protein